MIKSNIKKRMFIIISLLVIAFVLMSKPAVASEPQALPQTTQEAPVEENPQPTIIIDIFRTIIIFFFVIIIGLIIILITGMHRR